MDEDLDQIIDFLNDKEIQPLLAASTHSMAQQPALPPVSQDQVQSNQQLPQNKEENSASNEVTNSQQTAVEISPISQQKAMHNQNHHNATNMSQIQTNTSQLQSQNISQSYTSIEQPKKNQFIIRKTQNKRVMSQIRNNGMRAAGKQSSSSKKRGGLPELRHNETQISDYGRLMMQQIHPHQLDFKTKTYYQPREETHKISEMKENYNLQDNNIIQPSEAYNDTKQLALQEVIPSKLKKKALVFRPYEDPMSIKPYQPPDRGYYFKFQSCDVKIIRYTLEDNGFREVPNKESKDASVFWSCSALKTQFYQFLTKYQKINHFPSSFHITRKDLMYKSVSKMREIYGHKNFNFIPKTFLLPNEYIYLEAEMEKDKDKIWIAKPAASSQGKGIIVTKQITDIPNKSNPYIVSEYIGNPLLFDGYKFDLRIYVAITCVNPLRIYIYEEGLTRFATSKYNNNSNFGNSKQAKYTHLTNYSLNKNNPNFVANTDSSADNVGSKWSITALRKALKDAGIDDNSIWKKIEDIIIKTILSAESTIFQAVEQYVPFRNNCFELLGFDILIDNNLDPWLLEVNLSPSLACDSPLDQKIKGNLIAELFTLAGIVPLEQRQGVTEGIYSKKATGLYGAYQQNDFERLPPKRDSYSAAGGKRKDSKNQASAEVNSYGYGVMKQSPLSVKQERQLLKEVDSEFKRRGKFKRVFPSVDYHYYKQFFVEERYLNHLIDQKVMSKRRLNNAVTSAIQVKQKIDHINTKSSFVQQQSAVVKKTPTNIRKQSQDTKQQQQQSQSLLNQDLEPVKQ